MIRNDSKKNTHRQEFIVATETVVTTNNQMNMKCKEEVQIILSGKHVRTEIPKVVQFLQAKQVENTETSPSNDTCCRKFLVEHDKIITIKNQVNSNRQKHF